MDPACRRRIRPRGRSAPATAHGGTDRAKPARHQGPGRGLGDGREIEHQVVAEFGDGGYAAARSDQRRRRRTAAPIAQSPLAIRAQVEGSGTGVKLSIRLLPNSETENMPPPSAFWKRLPESTKK